MSAFDQRVGQRRNDALRAAIPAGRHALERRCNLSNPHRGHHARRMTDLGAMVVSVRAEWRCDLEPAVNPNLEHLLTNVRRELR